MFMYHDASTALLLDLRRRLKAVVDVLHAITRDWITLARSLDHTAQWDGTLLLCRISIWQGEVVLVSGVEGLHRKFSDFIHKVVVHRREEAIRGWRTW